MYCVLEANILDKNPPKYFICRFSRISRRTGHLTYCAVGWRDGLQLKIIIINIIQNFMLGQSHHSCMLGCNR